MWVGLTEKLGQNSPILQLQHLMTWHSISSNDPELVRLHHPLL
jgi:hypothetical protein